MKIIHFSSNEKRPTSEGSVGGDWDRGETHDDVGHRHVDQVHPGVDPQEARSCGMNVW